MHMMNFNRLKETSCHFMIPMDNNTCFGKQEINNKLETFSKQSHYHYREKISRLHKSFVGRCCSSCNGYPGMPMGMATLLKCFEMIT